jgi:hypothetical protein
MNRSIWNRAALILFLLADFISTAVLKARSMLADEAGTPIKWPLVSAFEILSALLYFACFVFKHTFSNRLFLDFFLTAIPNIKVLQWN